MKTLLIFYFIVLSCNLLPVKGYNGKEKFDGKHVRFETDYKDKEDEYHHHREREDDKDKHYQEYEERPWRPYKPYGDFDRLKPVKKDPKDDKYYPGAIIPGKPYVPPFSYGYPPAYPYFELPIYPPSFLYTYPYLENAGHIIYKKENKEKEKPYYPFYKN